MPRSALVGSRIRERRTVLKMRQAELARAVGISPSYLNLIEHNRRRIGGKLLVDIARQLEVETTALTEGAGATLVASLRDAASGHAEAEKEMSRIEEFVGRFPGWAQLLSTDHRRIDDLERTVEALTERMAHDPFLSESLHEILSTVTAIRSTAAILNDTQDIDPEWRARFHRNMFEESQRLTDGAQALVSYLDSTGGEADVGGSPQEEVVAFLQAREFHLPDLEGANAAKIDDLVADDEDLKSSSAVELAQAFLRRYREDVEKVPLDDLLRALDGERLDPSALARHFGVDLSTILRRLASVPRDKIGLPIGLVECDGSGTLTYRKEIEGFPLPRFGAACPLWPLYQALAQPMMPVHKVVSVSARSEEVFETYAVCQSINAEQFDEPQVYRAVMLFFPRKGGDASDNTRLEAGTSCRICERRKCVARREPSILADGL